MKTILILRHAKSDWGNAGLTDFDRPLARRGLTDAPIMGEVLDRFDYVPDLILASPAERAKQTAELVAGACGYDVAMIDWHEEFYEADSEDILASLRSISTEVTTALVIGHNPTLEDTVIDLLNGNGANLRLPTAGLVCVEADIADWQELTRGDGVLRWFIIPKLIKAIR